MNIIKKYVMTEKASNLSKKLNKYIFFVNLHSNKKEIKKCIHNLYNVSVLDVNIIRYKGKKKVKNTKKGIVVGRKSQFKKAIVSLRKGDIINIYENK